MSGTGKSSHDSTDEPMLGYGAMGRGRGRTDPSGEAISGGSSSSRSAGRDDNQSTQATRQDRRALPRSMLVTKPKHILTTKGEKGTKLDFVANYFRFDLIKSFFFYHYYVKFEPEVDNVKLRRPYVRLMFTESFPGVGFIYDQGAQIFTTHRLEPDQLPFRYDGEHRGANFGIVINTAGAGGAIEVSEAQRLDIFNMVLRRAMGELKLKQVGRNLYDSNAKVELNALRLELWPGYITSIRKHEKNVLVNCELTHKVMRRETVYDILRDFKARGAGAGDWQHSFKHEIIGKVVLTDYNNQTYKISDVDFNKNPQSTFDMKGRQQTFAGYYQERYNLQIRDNLQPLLVVNPSPRDILAGRTADINLIPELCRTTGLPDSVRNDFRRMREFSEATRTGPHEKAERLEKFSQRLRTTTASEQELKKFNVRIDQRLIRFAGRQIDPQSILFNNSSPLQLDDKADWTMAFRNHKLLHTVPLRKWIVICEQAFQNDAQNFIRIMQRVSVTMGYEMGNPLYEWLPPRARKENYIGAIEKLLQQKTPQLLFVVVPDDSKDRYDAIKKYTYCNYAMPSQVIKKFNLTSKKGDSGIMSIATKVAIQTSCKIGGTPWLVSIPLKGLMTVGFDVSHGPKQERMSYGAFVATMDMKHVENMQYYSGVVTHHTGEEISVKMAQHMHGALQKFLTNHGAYPRKIFFYRDGVGEGQMETVFNVEMMAIKNELKKIDPTEQIGLTFIVVNKRTNTRIFYEVPNQRKKNPPPGSVVDDTITLNERYEFYLISQETKQGCVTPTSYNILEDTSSFSPDQIQLLTYKLCHLYYNWSGTLKVPAVVQCAHKLSKLVGENLRETPHPELSNMGVLYFL